MANKIFYGVSNVYYAKITTAADGTVTYGTPVAIPGCVGLNLDQEGEMNPFYADNIIYYQSTSNNGYPGTAEFAEIPDSFKTDILNEVADTNSVLVEKANVEPEEFALLFQFEGDENAVKHSFLRCKCTRPSVASTTKEASVTPGTISLNISAMPRIKDQYVKLECKSGSAAYANWTSAVYEPTGL